MTRIPFTVFLNLFKQKLNLLISRNDQLNQGESGRFSLPQLKQNYGKFFQQFSLLFFPTSILIGSILANSYYREIKSRKAVIQADEQRAIEVKKTLIKRSFMSLILDVQNLAEGPDLQEYFTSEEGEPEVFYDNVEHIEEEFASFAKYQQLYHQIRLLDTTGQEIVRINYRKGKTELVPQNLLENKADRDYFKTAIALPKGSIYISSFDLNQENGKIDRPFTASIRLAAPVYTQNELQGIVVLNYMAEDLQKQLTESSETTLGKSMLLNKAGFWLLSPNSEQEWGFILPERAQQTFGRQFPQAWQQISLKNSGQVHTPEGMFTFTTFDPENIAEKFSQVNIPNITLSQNGRNSYGWKIVSYISPQVLLAESYQLLGTLLWLYLCLNALLALAVGGVTIVRTRHQLANAELEQIQLKFMEAQRRDWVKSHIASQILHSLDLNTILETAVNEIYTLLKIERCTFTWYRTTTTQSVWEVVAEAKNPELVTAIGCYPGEIVRHLCDCFLNGEILQIDDISTLEDLELKQLLVAQEYKSLLGLPIQTSSRVLGVLSCSYTSKVHHWQQEEIILLQKVVEQLGIAINQAQLYTDTRETALALQERTAELQHSRSQLIAHNQVLIELSKNKVLTQGNFLGACQEINEVVSRTLAVKQVGIWLLDDSKTKLQCVDFYNLTSNEHTQGVEILVADYPNYFQGWKSSRLIVSNDVVSDSRMQELLEAYLKPSGITSMLEALIHWRGQIIGVICLEHIGTPRTWSLEEQNFASALADLVSLALEASERVQAEIQLQSRTRELENTLQKLRLTQAQMVQSEKMSSLGQMVAGIAHEINNPVSFIHGNLVHATQSTQELLELLNLYQQHFPDPPEDITEAIEDLDLDFLREDLNKLFKSMQMGTSRISEIVKSLRTFSRLDESQLKAVNIHEGIDSTLIILRNRMNAKPDFLEIKVIKEYEKLPLVECYAGEINQVFMNIFSNAIDAIEERKKQQQRTENNDFGTISIHTTIVRENWVAIRITDDGWGIPADIHSKLFDPFFTTKEIGKGTGLGLSISYQIVVEHHGGHLICNSQLGEGTEFIVEIPIKQSSS